MAAALAEAGELHIPLTAGTLGTDMIRADLVELCRGATVCEDPGDVTVFKSVGLAVEDLVVAAALVGGVRG